MTSVELHEINRMLGGLKQAVDIMTDQWRRQEASATEGRRQLYDKFEQLQRKFEQLSHRVDQVARELALIQPDIKRYNEKRLRDEGARHLGKVLWGAMLTAAGLTGWAITAAIHWLISK